MIDTEVPLRARMRRERITALRGISLFRGIRLPLAGADRYGMTTDRKTQTAADVDSFEVRLADHWIADQRRFDAEAVRTVLSSSTVRPGGILPPDVEER